VKGKKQVACLSSAETGALITVVMWVSASGIYVPRFDGLPSPKHEGLSYWIVFHQEQLALCHTASQTGPL
jgi:hypothetical protein